VRVAGSNPVVRSNALLTGHFPVADDPGRASPTKGEGREALKPSAPARNPPTWGFRLASHGPCPRASAVRGTAGTHFVPDCAATEAPICFRAAGALVSVMRARSGRP
jgi:hypothetical protein